MEGIVVIIATAIAVFVWFSNPCDKKKKSHYRPGCRLCCDYDECKIRWYLDIWNEEELQLEIAGYEVYEN